jgi:hypothetical protein
LGKEQAPTDAKKKSKWDNKNDEACGLIGMSISLDLQFHLQGIDGLDESWTKLEVVFGKHNVIQAHQNENLLMNLSANDFLALNIIYLSSNHLDLFLKIVK